MTKRRDRKGKPHINNRSTASRDYHRTTYQHDNNVQTDSTTYEERENRINEIYRQMQLSSTNLTIPVAMNNNRMSYTDFYNIYDQHTMRYSDHISSTSPITTYDFASLYPSLMESYNIAQQSTSFINEVLSEDTFSSLDKESQNDNESCIDEENIEYNYVNNDSVITSFDDYVCSICCDVFVDCVILTHCGHEFCRKCITDYMKIKDQHRIDCPICRKKFTNDITSLCTAIRVNAIVDSFLVLCFICNSHVKRCEYSKHINSHVE